MMGGKEKFRVLLQSLRCSLGRTISLLFVATLMLSLAIPASAQRFDGTLRGTVVDESGAVVPDARVTSTNPETRDVQVMTTTSSGTHIFPTLLSGTYSVAV